MDDSSQKPEGGFEKSLAELESLVQEMEQGSLSLEDSLQRFGRGVALAAECRDALDKAQQQVDILQKRDGDDEPVPFDPRGDADR